MIAPCTVCNGTGQRVLCGARLDCECVRALHCENIIDMRKPIASERVRGFQPPWRTVFVYRCSCGAKMRMRAGSFRGGTAEPSIGGVRCGAIIAQGGKS